MVNVSYAILVPTIPEVVLLHQVHLKIATNVTVKRVGRVDIKMSMAPWIVKIVHRELIAIFQMR